MNSYSDYNTLCLSTERSSIMHLCLLFYMYEKSRLVSDNLVCCPSSSPRFSSWKLSWWYARNFASDTYCNAPSPPLADIVFFGSNGCSGTVAACFRLADFVLLRRNPKGKVQKVKYLLAVDLDRFDLKPTNDSFKGLSWWQIHAHFFLSFMVSSPQEWKYKF